MERSDRELLSEFVESGSGRAFEALVQRHAAMVFGIARRVTKSRELAEDTAQFVFAIMLRKARVLADHPSLAAWLHKTATLEASRLMRKERNHHRKLNRLASAVALASEQGSTPDGAADHPALEHLDEAMAQLGSDDRRFLMLRFYQGYKLRELAPVLGKSEAAVRKQSERAISRLSEILRKRGVVVSAAALVGLLSQVFVESAPVGLVSSITQGAAATSASLSSSTLVLNTLQTMTYGKQIALTATAVALLAAIPIGIQTHRLGETRAALQNAQTVTTPPLVQPEIPPADVLARPDAIRSGPRSLSLREQAADRATTDAEFLRDLLTRQVRPRYEEINAFIGEHRSLTELRSMFDEVADLPFGEHKRAVLQKLVMEIGRHDGQHAVEFAASSVGSAVLRHQALGAAYAGWGSRDPAAAWAFATALPPEQRAAHPYWRIMTGAAEGDLSADRFYHFVETHSPDVHRLSGGHLWQALTHVYDHKDSEGMPSWVEGLPPGQLKNLASSHLVQRWAHSDPMAAKEWMEIHVDPQENPSATLELAKSWARVDPNAAMDWVTSLPKEMQTKEHYSGALELWLRYDQIGAANWLAEAEPSPLLDVPFERYVDRVRHANPPEAMNWAQSITDSAHRLRVMKKVADVWRRKDADGLQQFLATDPAGESLR